MNQTQPETILVNQDHIKDGISRDSISVQITSPKVYVTQFRLKDLLQRKASLQAQMDDIDVLIAKVTGALDQSIPIQVTTS